MIEDNSLDNRKVLTNKTVTLNNIGMNILTFECPICGEVNKRIAEMAYMRSKQVIECKFCQLLFRIN
jgi:transcription elongation factor Elf1